MPDRAMVTQHIDAFDISPVDEIQRGRASLNVCSVMGRLGHTSDQIREVLDMLDLTPPPTWASAAPG